MRGTALATAMMLAFSGGLLVTAGSVTDRSDHVVWGLNLGAGGIILAIALLARRFAAGYAALALLAGLAWLFGDAVTGFVLVHRPLLMWMALAFPTATLRTSSGRLIVALALVAAAAPALAKSDLVWLSIDAGFAVAAVLELRGDSRPTRGEARVAAGASLLLALSIAFPATGRLLGAGPDAERLLLVGYLGLVLSSATTLLAGIAGQPGRDTDAVIELTGADPAETLELLRRQSRHGASAGRPAVRAAIALLADHERLTTDLARRSMEVRASQDRLRQAAELEQLRLQRLLDRGALPLIDDLAAELAECARLGDTSTAELAVRCCREVDAARADLTRLLTGMHPEVLTARGLAAALGQLTEGFALPVEVCVAEMRFPAAVEATLWYVCAEVVANMGKHSAARAGRIDIWRGDHHVVARIADDGVGGATEAAGGGLQGLRERVAAVGGTLRVCSPTGGGTVVEVRVPCQ